MRTNSRLPRPFWRLQTAVSRQCADARWMVAGLSLLLMGQDAAHTQSWQPIPLVTQATRSAGLNGGEGAQWPRDIEISQADPNFLLMGTDVGGVFRSLDGGKNWQIASVGWNSRGAWAIALDPKNASRALAAAFGSYSYGKQANGLYLTTNKGASWKQVLATDSVSNFGTLAYDASSYTVGRGYCSTAYWASADGGIYKTTDGGSGWSRVNGDHGNNNTRLKVQPLNGHVYLASNDGSDHGLWRSTDGGVSFTQVSTDYLWGLDIVDSAPTKVFQSRYSWVHVYDDATGTDTITGTTGLPGAGQPYQYVTVSRANPNQLATWVDLGNYDWRLYRSGDGGATWNQATTNAGGSGRGAVNSILPFNVRQWPVAWHPTDPSIAFSFGGDWVTRSTDGGANFTWSNSGYNGIFATFYNFSPTSPNTFLIGTKDYNSYVTTDGGTSWRYAETGFDFGGYAFGGFALNSRDMWVGDDPTFSAQGDPLLKVSHDGGSSWSLAVDAQNNHITVATNGSKFGLLSAGDPTDRNTGFIGAYCTHDRGYTWTLMTGCDQVYTYNPTGRKELYGKFGADIVTSTDHGQTWQTAAANAGNFQDIAYDPLNHRFWIAINDGLTQYANGVYTAVSNLPLDQYGTTRTGSVAVDPGNPNVIYATNHRDIWLAQNSVVRSTDGGRTWKNITVNSPLPSSTAAGGPHEGWWVRVHPLTHDAWVATNCFGVWKYTFRPVPQLTVDDSATGTGQNQWNYVGTGWQVVTGYTGAGYFNGSKHYSNTVNDYATLAFTGSRVSLYVGKGQANGIVGVSLDGDTETLVNTYAGVSDRGNQLVYSSPATLLPGSHTLKVRVTGKEGVAATDVYLAIDRVVVSP